MRRALQNREPKISTISCHRGIRHQSNARAVTPGPADMRADVALLKLHCGPNDLDWWVEALSGSGGLLSISLPPLYAGGESVQRNTGPILRVAKRRKCNPPPPIMHR